MARMDWFTQRCQVFFGGASASPRPGWISLLLPVPAGGLNPTPSAYNQVATLSLLLYPVLRMVGDRLHSAITGSYIAGTHSVAFISCPNEETARDIARAIMEKKLAACVNILPKASTMSIWKGEIEEASEIILLVKTRTSKIKQLSDYVRSMHPFEIPELISMSIDQGNPVYLQWMGENIPDD